MYFRYRLNRLAKEGVVHLLQTVFSHVVYTSFIAVAISASLCANRLHGFEAQLQEAIYSVVETHESAIVRVKAAFRQEQTGEKPSQINLRVGTGFFVSREGHILVNASRALGADRIGVEYKGRVYPAEAIGHDSLTNVSLIRLLKTPENFGIVPLALEQPLLPLGTFVVSLSCPLDFSVSPNLGIFTGVDKKLGDRIFPTAYFRTSIPIGSGQGGCPIFDRHGQLIGMTIASIPEMKGSYALPVSALARVKEDLMASGQSLRAWIGLEVKENISGSGEHNVFVAELIAGGPAKEGGLKEGDQILSICDIPIHHITDLPTAIFKTHVNQLAPVLVRRKDKELYFSIKAVPKPSLVDGEREE